MTQNIEAMIQEAEDITQEVFAKRWQMKVIQYLDSIGQYEALEKIRKIKSGNIFDDLSAQAGILIALKENGLQESSYKASNPLSVTRKLEVPENVTCRWLLDHVPYKMWLYFFGLIFAIFGLGIRLGGFENIQTIWETITK